MVRQKEGLRESIKDARTLTGAAWGAATKKSVLEVRQRIISYLEQVNKESLHAYNPEESVIKDAFASRIIGAEAQSKHTMTELLTVPWSSRRIKGNRLAASLIAFSNDHGKNTVPEFFPTDEIFKYLEDVKKQASDTGKPLTLVDQYDLALQQTNSNPVAAALLAHSAYRSVARSCDTRLDPRLDFQTNSSTGAISMMDIARSTADFAVKDAMHDPLGNTYHWWSQFTAGMVFSLLKRKTPLQIRVYNTAFRFGPELTKGIRTDMLGMPLDAGDHKHVDRQGMRVGRAMGHLIVNKIKPSKVSTPAEYVEKTAIPRVA